MSVWSDYRCESYWKVIKWTGGTGGAGVYALAWTGVAWTEIRLHEIIRGTLASLWRCLSNLVNWSSKHGWEEGFGGAWLCWERGERKRAREKEGRGREVKLGVLSSVVMNPPFISLFPHSHLPHWPLPRSSIPHPHLPFPPCSWWLYGGCHCYVWQHRYGDADCLLWQHCDADVPMLLCVAAVLRRCCCTGLVLLIEFRDLPSVMLSCCCSDFLLSVDLMLFFIKVSMSI